MSFFSYKIKGCTTSPKLYYEVGWYDREKFWCLCVVSGPLFKTFEEADAAAMKEAVRVDRIYGKYYSGKTKKQLA